MKILILRYGEINLKGKNRNFFERALSTNLDKKLKKYDCNIQKQRNRIFLEVADADLSNVLETVQATPGIENISIADECDSTYDAIKEKAKELFNTSKPIFRVSTKRSDKKFPFTSQELSKKIGGEILRANDGLKGLKVSLKDYKQEIGIEITGKKTYIFHKKIPGIGGLPIGSGGRGIVLLSGGIDSPVAAISAMKRGIKIDCMHFSTPPYTSEKVLEKIKTLIEKLKVFDPDIKLFEVNLTEMQLAIKEYTTNKFALLLMRRMMYRHTSNFAKKKKYQMILTGESIGQVASQTIESITLTNMVSSVPIIRPLITFNKNEIIEIAQKYNTYETSIIPYEDACTVFAPQRPVIKPELEETLEEEKKFPYTEYLDRINTIEIKKKNSLIDEYI